MFRQYKPLHICWIYLLSHGPRVSHKAIFIIKGSVLLSVLLHTTITASEIASVLKWLVCMIFTELTDTCTSCNLAFFFAY